MQPVPVAQPPLPLQHRVSAVIENFDELVSYYDAKVPFRRDGQYESHRRTIDRRLELNSLSAAIADDVFTGYLYQTLQLWGIGRRASHLVPLDQFRLRLQECQRDIDVLDGLSIEDDSLDVENVIQHVDKLISHLRIVDNKSLIVPGTKTLHHLLPDLVPPMDRRFTGAFFGWWPIDPQSRQTAIFTTAFRSLAEIARATKPARLVGTGWRTSPSKLLDNGVVAYCLSSGIKPRGT